MESTALEVALGIAVIFFLAATVVNALNEGLTRTLNLRSKALWSTLEMLLDPTDNTSAKRVDLTFLRALIPGKVKRPTKNPAPGTHQTGNAAPPAGVAADLLQTPSIWALDYVKQGQETKVWNIPTKVFTSSLLELAAIKGSPTTDSVAQKVQTLTASYGNSPLGHFLSANATALAGDVDKFTDGVGDWFDGQMQRLTDSYRRITKYTLAIIGLLVAITFNVDAIAIASGLASNADERQAVVLLADNIDSGAFTCSKTADGAGASQQPTTPAPRTKDGKFAPKANAKKGTAGTPADNSAAPGAGGTDLRCAADKLGSFKHLGLAHFGGGWRDNWKGDDLTQTLTHLFGLVITAFAVGLGGPFWFDTVGALAGLRRKQA